jgi:adenosylmethionine-8-amino-7-oxononanoate aminotransferase
MPSPDARLAEAGESAEAYASRCADFLGAYLKQHHAEIAAFIIEPMIQCASGMGMYHPAYLKRAREICTQYQVHLIADEIAVGFGRTGTMFACEHANIKPDFICLSKGITGGYLPLSVTLTSDEIYQAFYDDSVARGFLHSHSYTGNALACSAALATLAIFEQDDVLRKNQAKTSYISGQISTWNDLPMTNVRNQGMVWAFDVQTKNKQFQQHFYQQALAEGLLLRPIGNTVYWMPPYVISQDEIDFMLKTTKQVVLACA